MTGSDPATETPSKPFRVWPAVVLVLAMWLIRFVIPLLFPAAAPVGIIGEMVVGLALLVWWLFFSRMSWNDRIIGLAALPLALLLTSRAADVSITTGARGMLLPILAVPIVSLAIVLWALLCRSLSDVPRRAAMVAAIFVACASLILVRTGGFTGDFRNDLHWRWTQSPEERLLAQPVHELPPPSTALAVTEPAVSNKPAAGETPKVSDATPTPDKAAKNTTPNPVKSTQPADELPGTGAIWPGFRGPMRDGKVPGVRIDTDWASSPPAKLWQHPIGPGWSSMAVRGDLVYTQEQRGPDELVSCYRLSTGEPVWSHRDAARFWESNAGAGPRGTPTIAGSRVYTFGATGLLNALDALSGRVMWSRNAASDQHAKTPEWGFASSPLVLDDLVIVAISGRLAGYDRATGSPRWVGPYHRTSYSSPQLFKLGGIHQVLLVSADGATSVTPNRGKTLWEYAWKGYPIVQPAVTPDGDVLISVDESSGIRRIAVEQTTGSWEAKERWSSKGLKPYFNDFVVHKGFAYGFDGSILSCIDLEDGKRKWKGGRFGHGQLLLLPDQDLLVVLSEDGEFALVRAVSDGFTEVGKFKAIEGKTWNHPVLAGSTLLARNGEEIAAFRVKLAAE